jgi:uncharacterized protein YecE (DUF72 family)
MPEAPTSPQRQARADQPKNAEAEDAPMHPIRIGSCGWSYPEWAGPFYPKGTPSGAFLTTYAERFEVVEVDSTFYHSPSRKLVEGWRDKTPANFGFSLKVPQAITHEKLLADCEAEVDAFLAAARLLEAKLLCCCLQFGYFNREKFASQDAFLGRLEPFLERWPRDVPVAVEIRNKTWMNTKLAEVLRRHQAVWVLADQVWMPTPAELLAKLDVLTGSFAYIRLLGDRAAVDKLTDKLDHTVIDRSEQIDDDAKAISQLAARVPVLTFVNNHYAGYAPETIRQLREALGIGTY